jgi:hypothetical protein
VQYVRQCWQSQQNWHVRQCWQSEQAQEGMGERSNDLRALAERAAFVASLFAHSDRLALATSASSNGHVELSSKEEES